MTSLLNQPITQLLVVPFNHLSPPPQIITYICVHLSSSVSDKNPTNPCDDRKPPPPSTRFVRIGNPLSPLRPPTYSQHHIYFRNGLGATRQPPPLSTLPSPPPNASDGTQTQRHHKQETPFPLHAHALLPPT